MSLKEEIDSLKAVAARCRYEINKDFFNDMFRVKYDTDVCDAFWSVRTKDGSIIEKHKEAFSCNKIGYLWHPCQLMYDMNKYRMPYILSKYFGYKKKKN